MPPERHPEVVLGGRAEAGKIGPSNGFNKGTNLGKRFEMRKDVRYSEVRR